MKTPIVCTLALLVIALSLRAQSTYYVSAGQGSDSNDGLSQATAFATIGQGTSAAQPGDTINILSGTYRNNNDDLWNEFFLYKSGSPGNYITYRGVADAQGNLPKIEGASVAAITLYNSSYLVIENLELLPSKEDRKGMIADSRAQFGINGWRERKAFNIAGGSHHVIVRNNYVHDFPGNGIAAGDADVLLIENNLVEHCAYENNKGNSGISLYQVVRVNVPGFAEYPDHRIIIRDNISRYNTNLQGFIYANSRVTDGNGIIIDDFNQAQKEAAQRVSYTGRTLILENVCYGNGGYGINVFSSNHADVYNNTLYDNGQSARITNPAYEVAVQNAQLQVGGYEQVVVNDANFINNLLINTTDASKTYTSFYTGNITFNRNIHWNTTGSLEGVSSNDIVADPQFVGAVPLTQQQTDLLATTTNPFNPNSPSAQVRTPTQNNGFPVQDLRLQEGSPAIDAGVALGFGTPQGQAIDIGALEYGAGGPALPRPEADKIVEAGFPSSVVPGTTISVPVSYTATTTRDIYVSLQLDRDPFTPYGSGSARVAAGSGTVNISVPVRAITPLATDAYQLQAFITPVGKGWFDRIDSFVKEDVDAVSSQTAGGSLLVRAQGDCGSEVMELHVEGVKVKEWTVSTTMSDYVYEGFAGGEVSVHLVNDALQPCDRNLRVDYIEVCGTSYQTEAVATKTSTCCPNNLEKLFTDGDFNFGGLACSSGSVQGASATLKGGSGLEARVYPNPAESEVVVEGPAHYQVQVYDLEGRRLQQVANLSTRSAVDVSSLRPGVYLLQLTDTDTGHTRQQRLIVE